MDWWPEGRFGCPKGVSLPVRPRPLASVLAGQGMCEVRRQAGRQAGRHAGGQAGRQQLLAGSRGSPLVGCGQRLRAMVVRVARPRRCRARVCLGSPTSCCQQCQQQANGRCRSQQN